MKLRIAVATAIGLFVTLPGTAMAASCFDLWYARNQIYDDNGYCFRTDLALDYFDNSDCWTRNPEFSRADQRAINEIVAEEKRKHCKVN